MGVQPEAVCTAADNLAKAVKETTSFPSVSAATRRTAERLNLD